MNTHPYVTPHAGVWIETADFASDRHWIEVTPHAGVWIETADCRTSETNLLSLPTRECGLKHCFHCSFLFASLVTPHAGVWIETKPICDGAAVQRSLPTRECGLKRAEEIDQ